MASLVGKPAPEFSATAVINQDFKENFSLKNFKGKNIVFFFYPLDFTFVCPTELHAYQEKLSDFRSRNTEIVACSIDSQFSHLAWLNTPKEKGGIQGVTYPIVADINKTISRDYGVLIDNAGIALRGTFLIDKDGIVRQETINDLPLGRSVEEALRLVDALLFHEEHGEVCPANWKKGEKAMKADTAGLQAYFSKK
jgi:peroxiredoxin 2/4